MNDNHPIADPHALNAIKNDTLSKVERDFVDVLPERFRLNALSLYKDYRKVNTFTSVFERSRMTTAWMSGFVTATFMTQKEAINSKPAFTPDIPGN